MVCILPTTEELDAALARANVAHAARQAQRGLDWFPGGSFEVWCRWHADRPQVTGPVLDANVIGAADAKLLADAFDFAMRYAGSQLRARRRGF